MEGLSATDMNDKQSKLSIIYHYVVKGTGGPEPEGRSMCPGSDLGLILRKPFPSR